MTDIRCLRATIATLICLVATPLIGQTGKLTIRVLDEETGKPFPARLALKAADGTYPGDRLGCSAKQWPGIILSKDQ